MAEITNRPFPGLRRLDGLCYLLVWTGAMGLFLVPEAAPQLILAFCLAILPSRFLGLTAQRSAAYRTVWRLITVMFILLSLLDWYWNGRPLRQTLVAQMCFFQAYKAYNSKGHWDYLEMALFATLMIVFCGLVTTSVFFLVILVPFIAILVGFLLTLNLCRHHLLPPPKCSAGTAKTALAPIGYQVAFQDSDLRSSAASKLSWALQTMAVLLLGAGLFYVLPREQVFLPSHLAGDMMFRGHDPVTSGLSGGVNLRYLSAIKLDPRPVLKVTFPGRIPPQETIYLRSGALERLSNLEWCPVQPRSRVGRPDPDGTYWFQRVGAAERSLLIPHIVEFLNGPGEAPVALPGLVAISQLEPSPYELQIAAIGLFASLKRYRALSWGMEASQKPSPISEDDVVWSESLKLPEELTDLDLYQKATEITYGRADNLERAKAIEHHLRSRYAYTLNIEPLNGPASGPNPIERFLFTHPQGNCEVFASAMVVLLRNLRIPSRLVIGYHGGIRGDAPNEFVFRNEDAHAWVEVWSPQRGWVTFDPTPPPPLEVYSSRFSFKKMMEWCGSATGQWNHLIVWYDREAKARWMSSLWEPVNHWIVESRPDYSVFARLMPRLRENVTRPQIVALLAGLIGVNVVVAVLYLQGRRRWFGARVGRNAAHGRNDPWRKFYRSAVALLQGKVARRPPAQTPGEFLEALARTHSLDPIALGPIVELYYRGRFGRQSWNDQVAGEMDHLLRRLAEAVKET
jgi:hypothetical protein